MTTNSRFQLRPGFSLAWLILGGCGSSPVSSLGGPEAARSFFDALVRRDQTPGIQYVHVDRTSVLFEDAAGYADVRESTLVDPKTTFHGYSVTKTLTAAAVLKLAKEGKIELDAPISTWIDGLPDERVPTVRQTLEHVGGWANPVPVGWVHLAQDHSQHDETAFFERILKEHGQLVRAPGEKFAYSNVGYLVLGELVRRVSGQSYTEFVERELLAPLALDDGAALSFDFDALDHHATGYVRRWSFLGLVVGLFIDRARFLEPSHGAWEPFAPLLVDGPAYGGLLGSARGFARYLQAILRREGAFDDELVALMFQRGKLNNGNLTPAAHGWFQGELKGEPYFHHAGGGGGFYAEIRVYPRVGRASVVMMNRSAMSDESILDRIDPWLLPQATLNERAEYPAG